MFVTCNNVDAYLLSFFFCLSFIDISCVKVFIPLHRVNTKLIKTASLFLTPRDEECGGAATLLNDR